MALDLTDTADLKKASANAIELHRKLHRLDSWIQRLSDWLRHVESVDYDTFVGTAFQQQLWDSQTIAATGQGHIDVSAIISNVAIAERLWTLKETPLPQSITERIAWLGEVWEEISTLLEPLTTRKPRLKMYRVFASLWPEQFTTVAHYQKLQTLGKAMGLPNNSDHRTELHQRILERLDDAGVVTSSREERMTLPWVLLVHHVQDNGGGATELPSESAGDLRLNPLPAGRRRRGMLAINGSVASVLAMLEFAKGGRKRADFLEHIRSVNPKLATNSLGTNLHALIAEWGALRSSGDDLFLTPRGEAFLESGEPEEVSDWLLTQVLGFDNLLHMLKDGPLQHKQVITRLQGVNPGWTSNFAPTVLINWAKGMELAELDSAKILRLTERGQQWASRIHWTPGALAPVVKHVIDAPVASRTAQLDDLWSQLPTLKEIRTAFPEDLVFDASLIAQLHAGLWNRRHQRRHFAVLTGLSGAGKTQLAIGYAKALWAGQAAENPSERGWHVVAVQPGWHDPSSLLGYVNPIDSDVYMRTGFLEFLLRASADPDRPYVALLDEMNLSHPEQYLAPLLSAMESGDDIELHALGDEVGDVPGRIPYPSNLVLIGTVNMDETTHGLSDKVLDRSAVIEFWDINVIDYPGWEKETNLPAHDVAMVRDVLVALMAPLRAVRLHFGWRTIADVLGYVEAGVEGGELSAAEALDHSVYAKILPKLRGEDTKRLRDSFDEVVRILVDRKLNRSAAKAQELCSDLREQGSARFWR